MTIPTRVDSVLSAFNLAPLFEESGIPLAVMGVLVVFIALTLVAALIAVLPRLVGRIQQAQRTQPAPVAPVDPEAPPEELVAVIAAAVATTVLHPHRIVHIRGPATSGWTLEGRMHHHQSHSIPTRGRR